MLIAILVSTTQIFRPDPSDSFAEIYVRKGLNIKGHFSFRSDDKLRLSFLKNKVYLSKDKHVQIVYDIKSRILKFIDIKVLGMKYEIHITRCPDARTVFWYVLSGYLQLTDNQRTMVRPRLDEALNTLHPTHSAAFVIPDNDSTFLQVSAVRDNSSGNPLGLRKLRIDSQGTRDSLVAEWQVTSWGYGHPKQLQVGPRSRETVVRTFEEVRIDR